MIHWEIINTLCKIGGNIVGKSYKKTPSAGRNTSGMKKCASHKSRRTLNKLDYALNGRQYKKFFPSWDIKEYVYIAPSFESFCKHELEIWEKWPGVTKREYRKRSFDFPTEKELRKKYDATYRRK